MFKVFVLYVYQTYKEFRLLIYSTIASLLKYFSIFSFTSLFSNQVSFDKVTLFIVVLSFKEYPTCLIFVIIGNDDEK